MKKALAVLTAVIILSGALATSYGHSDFSDVNQGNWALESIDAMSQAKILSGYPDGTFRPTAQVTYAEFIKMIVASGVKGNASVSAPVRGASASQGERINGDTAQAHWADGYYEDALRLGYFQRDDISRSALDQPIPRVYMALMISAALGDGEVENYDAVEATVNDVDSKVKYDYHIIKSYAAGILSGYPDKTFRPGGYLSRAEASIVLHRLMDPEKRTPVTGLEQPGETSGDEDDLEGELIISQENSFNPNLVWVKEGDIHEILDQSAIDHMQALAPLEKYIIVEDASQFELEMKSGPNYTWLEMKDNRAYGRSTMPFLITNGKISLIQDESYVWPNDTCSIFYKGDIKTVDYISLSPVGGGVITLIANPF